MQFGPSITTLWFANADLFYTGPYNGNFPPSNLLASRQANDYINTGNTNLTRFNMANQTVAGTITLEYLPWSTLAGISPAPAARTVEANYPEQLRLTWWAVDTMQISWATGDAVTQLYTAGLLAVASPLLASSSHSDVQWGVVSGIYTNQANADASNKVYQNFYNNTKVGDMLYSSPILHHAHMNGMVPGVKYVYRVGDLTAGKMSPEFSFVFPGATFPFNIGVMADLGTTDNATQTIALMASMTPSIVLFTGDISYADHFGSNGVLGAAKGDMFGRQLQTLGASVPIQTSGGNHETEPDSNYAFAAAWNARYPMPQTNTVNTNNNTVR
ncbi:MAG: hypothetical protein WDW36_006111 [Sanguina aurantia]